MDRSDFDTMGCDLLFIKMKKRHLFLNHIKIYKQPYSQIQTYSLIHKQRQCESSNTHSRIDKLHHSIITCSLSYILKINAYSHTFTIIPQSKNYPFIPVSIYSLTINNRGLFKFNNSNTHTQSHSQAIVTS